MSEKIIINGEEVVPAKKVKLDKFMKKTEIRDMLLKKQEELKNANKQLPSNTEES